LQGRTRKRAMGWPTRPERQGRRRRPSSAIRVALPQSFPFPSLPPAALVMGAVFVSHASKKKFPAGPGRRKAQQPARRELPQDDLASRPPPLRHECSRAHTTRFFTFASACPHPGGNLCPPHPALAGSDSTARRMSPAAGEAGSSEEDEGPEIAAVTPEEL
jgi:hypothetical protein